MIPSDIQDQIESDEAKDENTRSFHSHLGIVLSFVVSLTAVVVGILFSGLCDKSYTAFSWCLFLIPIVIHGVGWWSIHQIRPKPENKKSIINAEVSEKDKERIGFDKFCRFYNVTMIVSVALYCGAWIFYSLSSYVDLSLWALSLFCIIGIIIQFGILCYVTYTIMEISHKQKKYRLFLKSGLELSPFWRFAHFFAIFMSISFLFGFAFAFHDLEYRKIYKKPALLVENIASDEDIEKEIEKKNEEERRKKEVLNLDSPPVLSDDLLNPQPFCFYFESGRANMIVVEKDAGYFEPKNDTDRLEFMRFKKNFDNLGELTKQINANKSKSIPRLILIGSADDEPINTTSRVRAVGNSTVNLYPSNYELSEARIQVTQNEITKKVYKQNNGKWQHIDWVLVGHSNEEYINQKKDSENQIKKCQDIIYNNEGKNNGKRAVAVYLHFISPEEIATSNKIPNLMDYIYFSIYTITTTGYGDIKPATRYAKFLVSLENFFEVFFLVCFMNTLMALKSEPKLSSEC